MAVFVDGKLDKAWLSRSADKKSRGPKQWVDMAGRVRDDHTDRYPLVVSASVFVSEYPQVYPNRRGGPYVDPADLIQLAGVVGAVSQAIPAMDHVGYLPREWKAQVPKEIHNRRIEAKLSATERATIEPVPASLRNNVIDAVGIGLHYLGRI